MNRIETCFANLKATNKKALVTFTMAGDPDAQISLDILHTLAKSADILEVGMPFTDPMADGPVIQAAGLRALANGTTLKSTLAMVQQFRSNNKITPIVLMGYFNPVLQYGVDKFINDCSDLDVDGLIIVDIPPEEADEIAPKAQQKNISFIRLLTPTTDQSRLDKILSVTSGFLYYVSVAGVTGTSGADPKVVGAHIAHIKTQTTLPIVAGFGIKTPEDAKAMAAIADGVVVGSAIIETLHENSKNPKLLDVLGDKIGALSHAVKS